MIVLMTVPMCVADWPTTTGAISPRIRRTAGCRKSIRGAARSRRFQSHGSCMRSCPTPPRRTPTASPTTGSGSRGASTSAPIMIPTLSATGDSAGRQEVAVGVEDAHGQGRQAHEEQVREHYARHAHGQLTDLGDP